MKFSFFLAADVPCQLRLLLVPVFQGFFERIGRFIVKVLFAIRFYRGIINKEIRYLRVVYIQCIDTAHFR